MSKKAQKQKPQKQKPQPRRPVVEEIEPRILYSADFARGWSTRPHRPLRPSSGRSTRRRIHPDPSQDAQTRRHELVLVDTNTPDYQKLVDDIVKQAGDGRDIEVMLLDPSKDGIQQITDILAAPQGSQRGAPDLARRRRGGAAGTATLNFDTLLKNATQIKGWGKALTAEPTC